MICGTIALATWAGLILVGGLEPPTREKGNAMTERNFGLSRCVRMAAVLAFAALPLFASSGLAQDATPADAAATVDGPHPVHIHSGSCAELGEVVVPLTDVAERAGEAMGSGTGHAVKGSHTQVDMSLDDILANPHAINVHLSAEEIGTYIACGDLSGVVFEDADDGERMLIVGLGELNDSGHVGIAWLSEDDDGTTEVAVNLIEPDEMD
jgi:hypothetical protein